MSIPPHTRVMGEGGAWVSAGDLRVGQYVQCRRGQSWMWTMVKSIEEHRVRLTRTIRTRSGKIESTLDCLPYHGTPPRTVKAPRIGDMILLSDGGHLYVERIDMIEHMEMASNMSMIAIGLTAPGGLIADGILVGSWQSR